MPTIGPALSIRVQRGKLFAFYIIYLAEGRIKTLIFVQMNLISHRFVSEIIERWSDGATMILDCGLRILD
jgi:hypothetical protein